MTTAPIALFVYNRPLHTRRTVEALLRNELAGQSDLYIFSDAPKNPEAAEAVREVREYIRTITGFRSVNIVERDRNWGLANSIIDGITRLCNEFGRVIVLEDDLVTAPSFLRFMNEGLTRFADEERVASISGYSFPVDARLPEVLFLKAGSSWGWATWQRAWSAFDPQGERLLEKILERNLAEEFNLDGSYDFLGMLKGWIAKRNDSWAIRWYATLFLRGQLTLFPGKSLVNNIGHDGSGVHCSDSESYEVVLSSSLPVISVADIAEDAEVRSAVRRYFMSLRMSLYTRVLNKIARMTR